MADEWQDIATAPRDGSGIIVIDVNASAPGAGMAWIGERIAAVEASPPPQPPERSLTA